MDKYDTDLFRTLLRRAMGPNNSNTFAKYSGVSPQHIRRMLNTSYEGRPSISTIGRIAKGAMGRVSEKELLLACGHSLPKGAEEAKPAFFHSVDQIWFYFNRLQDGAQSALEERAYWKIVPQFLSFLVRHHFNGTKTDYEVLEDHPYEGDQQPYTERYSVCAVSIEAEAHRVDITFLVYYNATQEGAVMLTGVGFAGTAFHEVDALPAYFKKKKKENGLSYKEIVFVYKLVAKENRIAAFYPYLDYEPPVFHYIRVYAGPGFYTRDIGLEEMAQFIINHRQAFLTGENRAHYYHVFDEGEESILSALQSYKEEPGTGEGPLAAIAYIMRKESGFYFYYQNDPKSQGLKENKPCILAGASTLPANRQLVYSTIESYAKELGVIRYGDCYYQVIDAIDLSAQFYTGATKENL